jgi:isochorismate synthase
LRCMELFKDKAVLFVGGGITRDSNEEKEWEETVAKSSTMKAILI